MAVPREAKFAVIAFLLYIPLVLYIFSDPRFSIQQQILSFKTLLGLILTLLLLGLPHSEVTTRSALLGSVFASGILLNQYYVDWRYLGWYLCALSFFHFSEYIMTALYNADKLSVDSFLLNHSLEYKIAAVASWTEFLVEFYLIPAVKRQLILSIIGLCMVIFGEVMRKLAMMTAKSNFTHLVQYTKRHKHVLVTWGIYSWCRHPGYCGWFWWSIGTVFLDCNLLQAKCLISQGRGVSDLFFESTPPPLHMREHPPDSHTFVSHLLGTQVILCNPICIAAYTLASWQFFKDRIWDEEITLLHFFGQDYINYQNNVGTGLPFIDGFKSDTDAKK